MTACVKCAEHPVIRLTVNGRVCELAAAPFAPLSATLRDGLGLTGTKIGCEAGDCGACTVLVDGQAVCACLVPTGQAEGVAIETIEGGADGGTRDRLRRAFLAHGAAQCGICTPGMILAASALLKRVARPTKAEIEDSIGGVLCRCTGYVKIVEAIAAAAREIAPTPPPDAAIDFSGKPKNRAASSSPLKGEENHRAGEGLQQRAVGTRAERTDGWAKVTGTELFGADHAPAAALAMRVIRSPHAHAAFVFGDLEEFRRAHGLDAVLTAGDVPGENSFGIFADTKDQPVFAERHTRFRGEAVAALVGRVEALDAIDAAVFPIDWTPLPPLTGIDAATATGAPALHAARPDNVLTRGHLRCGDVAAAHAASAATVAGHFATGFVEHAYIEPEAGWAERRGDRIVVAATTQAPAMDREEVARVLGIALGQVVIQPTACGGGFGGKLDVSVQPLLAVAAWTLGRPVRIVYTRTESMASTTKRHPARMFARASADRDGRLTAFEMTADFNTGAYASWGPTVANRVPIHASGPYRVANVWNRTRAIYTNETPAGAFRGFGVPQAALAQEMLMDDLAETLGLDRWDIRRRNALAVGDATPSGQVLAASAGLPQCLDALRPAWDAALATAATHNAANARIKRGAGIACMWYGCGNTSLSNPSAMRIALSAQGVVTLWSGAVDIGQGSNTVMAQIAADALGVELAAIRLGGGGPGGLYPPDTDHALDAGKTSASRQTFVSGNAAKRAAEALRAEIVRYTNAGPRARFAFERGGDGRTEIVIAEAGAERRMPLASLEPFARGDGEIEGRGHYDPPTTPLDSDGQGIPYATYGFAAQIAEVLVDLALGTTKVLQIHAAHDVGRAINPTLTEGQIHGGIAQGLGLALLEEFVPGRTENLHDYLIPTVGDMPDVTIHLIEDPEPEGPDGAKGVGEPALVATAPAILGAIRHATGVTMRQVPVLPHRLWAALQQKGGVA